MRRGVVGMIGAALFGSIAPSSVMRAQSVLTAVYTPIKSTPTGDDFAQNFVVIGKFSVTINSCNKSSCSVRLSADNQPSNLLKVRIGATAPAVAADCNTTVPTGTNPTLLVGSTNAFPTTFTVWVCYH